MLNSNNNQITFFLNKNFNNYFINQKNNFTFCNEIKRGSEQENISTSTLEKIGRLGIIERKETGQMK